MHALLDLLVGAISSKSASPIFFRTYAIPNTFQMPGRKPARPVFHCGIPRSAVAATVFFNLFPILRIPFKHHRICKNGRIYAARAVPDDSLAQGKTCFDAVRKVSRKTTYGSSSDLEANIAVAAFRANNLFLSPSFLLPILTKSRGVPSGERDFARIGRGKEGEKGKGPPSRCATIRQSRKYKNHEILKSNMV